MPNPVKTLKSTRGLTARQKMLVAKIKRQGMTPKVYRRKGNTNKMSVHNPFLDVKRKSKYPVNKRIPHATDSDKQRSFFKAKAKKKKKVIGAKGRLTGEIRKFFVP